MPLFSENRKNLRLGQFSPVIIRRKRQELAKESVELKDRFRVLSSQQLKRLNQVIAEREAEVPNGIPPVLRNTAGFTTEVSEPTWGETLIKAPASGLAGVNIGLARLAKDVIKIADLPTDVARKVMGMKGERPDVEFLESYIESEKGRQAKLDISEKLTKLPHWHPKRILGTGLQAIPQVVAVAGGALMGAPFIGGATSAATMLSAIAYGPSAEEAKAEGANEIQQILHGVTSAQIEVLTELPVFKAVGQIWKHLKGAGIAKKVGVSFAKRLLTGLGLYGKGLALETTQEVEAYLGGQISKRLHYDPNATINFKDAVEAGYGGLSMAATIGIAGVPAMGVRAATKTPEARQRVIEAEMPEAPMTTISEETTNLASVKPLPTPMRAFGMREKPTEPAPIEPTAEVAREPVGVEAKESWEMTWGEQLAEYEKEIGRPISAKNIRPIQMKHLEDIKQALSEGKPVPESVLAEYPDLEPEKKIVSEKVSIEKKPVEFIGMQERVDKPPIPLVNELDTKSTVAYDSAKHEMTNLPEYEKAIAGEKVAKKPTIFVHETDKTFDKFDMAKAGTGQGEAWLGKGIYLQEKGIFKIEQYGDKKVEATIKPKANIFEVKETPDGKYRDTFVEYAVKEGLDGGLAEKRIKEGLQLKNLLPRDIFRVNPAIVEQLKKDGFDGLLQDGELVVYNSDILEVVSAKPLPPKPPKAKPSEAVTEEIKGEVIPEVKPKVEKEKVEVTPEKKEPWEITRDEYVKQYIEEQRAADFPEHMITDKYKESIMRDHFAVVSKAFAEDKVVPPEVLKDYPDLKAEEKVEVEIIPEGKEISIPKELKLLAIEARKYETAEEFEKVINKAIEESREGKTQESMISGLKIGDAEYSYEIGMALDKAGYKNITEFYNKATKKLEKPTGVEVLSETKTRLIENIKSEKGESILINDLARLGTDAIRRGHESFKAFSAQMKTTLSEVWDKIKHLMREAYEAAKVVLRSERGEIVLRPKKLTAAEKMLGIRKPKEKDIIEIYKEKHIALKPKRLRLTKETAKDFIAKVYTKFVFAEYPAIRLALKAKDPKVVQRVQDQINRVWGKGGIVEVFVAGKGPHRLDAEGKPVYIKDMQSLKEIVKDLNPQEYEDYETLRIAERDVALARFRPDIIGTDIELSTQVIEALERKYGDRIKKLRDTSKAQREYDDILLQLLVEEGWLSKKIYETIKARPESEFYASFVREMESVGEQVLGSKDPLKKIRGSELRKMPTIESSISNTYKTIKLLETIKLNKEIAKLKDLTPDLAEIIKEVKPHYIPVKQTLEAEIDPKMKRELDEVTKGLGATVETLKKVGRSKLGQFIHEMRGLGLTDEESNRIELKFATTEKTYAHELGHLIDRKFDLQTLLIKGKGGEYPVIKKELRKIADQRAADDVSAHYKKYIRKRTEQVAEFVARYLTQPDQARELAPTAVRKLEAFFNSKSQLKKLLTIRPSGQATLAKMSDVLFAKSPIPPKNTIIVPVNGMKHYWQIPADVHKAINYYSPQEMSMVIKILSWPARTLRAGATLTAEFIMRNPARDQFTAMAYSKYGYIPMWDLSKGFFELMKKGDLYQEFKAGGGEQSYFTSMDRTTLNLTARDIVGFKKGLKTYNPIEYLRIASEAMEKATRLGIFKRARNKGATVPEATAAARESTLDFRRIGEERRINQIVAFWNANIQGIDIMRRKLYKHPGRTLLRLTMGITLPSIALWLFNNSDDERKKRYNALPGWRKNFFWNIIIEDTPIISLPKPFELGLIFGSLPERILDYIALNDPKELKTIAQSIKDGAMPGLIPTAALPILENLTNWSFFMERPIESETIKRLPPGQRAHQYTSTVLKKFGKATNLSPIKLENWIRGWTGGLGKLGLDITDPLFETDEISEVTKHWYEVTPGLRGFVAKEPIGGAGKDIANFYDNLEKITQAEQGFKLLFKTDKEEADKFNKKTKGIKGFAASFRKTSRKLGKLRKRKSVIMESKEYTSDKKRELVDEIDERMTEIARARNETLLKPKQPISGMVPWKTKRKKKPAWQRSVGFGKKPSW
jgi:hypothetical protein